MSGSDGGPGDNATDGGPTRYPPDRIFSPLTGNVARTLRGIAERSQVADDRVFMKVGDSHMAISYFLRCFSGNAGPIDLDGRSALEPTIDYFRAGDAAGSSPFERNSLAVLGGRSAVWAVSGAPSPLEQEMAAIQPRYAVVGFGTNDMQLGTTYRSALPGFYNNLSALLEETMEQGILPIVFGLPPRSDLAAAAAWIPTYVAVTRGIAEALQLPHVDLHLALADLPSQGLSSDGVHANVYSAGGAQPCVFRPEALQFGYNVRNLLTLEALERTRQMLGTAVPTEEGAPPLRGDGSGERPFEIDRLPFTHSADTRGSPYREFTSYPSCDAGQDESGPEYVYRLTVEEPTPLRMIVLDRTGVDIDIHLLGDAPSSASCTARNDFMIERTLQPGTYHLALDTFVPAGGAPLAGPYLLVVLPCAAADPDCR